MVRFAAWCAVLVLASSAWSEDAVFSRYPCFVALEHLHAGSAIGGRFEDIGQLYLLPGSQAGVQGLYVMSSRASRFVSIEPPPTRSKDDFVLILDVVSHHEYAFVIRYEEPGSRFGERGWSIQNDANNRERPKKLRRVTMLLGGREPGTEDAIAEEIRGSIPHLNDSFDMPFTDEVEPIVTTFNRDFDPALHALNDCAGEIAEDDQELRIAAAVEQVELLRSLDRAVHNVIRDEGDPDWRQDLQDLLTEELCRRLACRSGTAQEDARLEAQRMVERFGDLQRLIASVRTTHGKKWEQPLLRQLLHEAAIDSTVADRIAKQW